MKACGSVHTDGSLQAAEGGLWAGARPPKGPLPGPPAQAYPGEGGTAPPPPASRPACPWSRAGPPPSHTTQGQSRAGALLARLGSSRETKLAAQSAPPG